jgi:hypothetical protein
MVGVVVVVAVVLVVVVAVVSRDSLNTVPREFAFPPIRVVP